MSNRKIILQHGFEASKIDYVGAFLRLWVSFNTWYNDQTNERSVPSEQERVFIAGTKPKIRQPFYTAMDYLNEADYTDNANHIIKTVEGLSVRTIVDSNGHEQTTRNDTTGFKYRLRCNRKNVHTNFLNSCIIDDNLRDWCRGLTSFNTETRNDDLFKLLYLGYAKQRSTAVGMALKYDAFNDIPKLLGDTGIIQYGSILFHDLNTPNITSTPIVEFRDIFDNKFVQLMGKANNYSSKRAVTRQFRRAGRKGKIFRWVESRGLDLLKRELLLLYKFRSSIVHGERDPKAMNVQHLAKTAYEALNQIMTPLFETSSN